MAETSSLLRNHTLIGIEGSNPSLSAILYFLSIPFVELHYIFLDSSIHCIPSFTLPFLKFFTGSFISSLYFPLSAEGLISIY